MASVIHTSPLGWWMNYDDKHWCGPYETDEAAIEEAQYLVPLKYKTYKLLRVAPWETKTIITKTGKEK
jgi:hypothetical protein